MIKQIKLTNGEDVVCDLEEIQLSENKVAYMIKNAYKILQMVNERGDMNIGFSPWFLYTDPNQSIFLSTQHIVAYTIPSSKIMSFYNKTINNEMDDEYEELTDTIGDVIH